MSQHYCVLILLHSILASTSALQRECSGYRPNKCTSPILCNEDEDCVITCNKLGCESSEIYCPLHGNCTIICQGLHSCTGATIYANSSIGNFDLICQANYANSNACRNIKVFGNTLPSSSSNTTTDHFNIICETCPTAEIHCAHSTDCQITCNGTMDSCQQMQIIGPLSNELYIQCEGTNACRNAIVSAYDTSDLFIDGCSDPYSNSCANLTVYCPSATNTKHCHLEGDNNLAMVQLYAVDGWNDIDIDYFGQYPHASGTMHCGSDYTISCDISSDSWSCADTSLCATNPTHSSTLSTAYTEALTLTNAPKARDGLVKEETTTIGSINTQYIVLVQHNDQQRLVTLLTIICGVLACIVCILVCVVCTRMCCVKPTNAVTEKHVIVHHVNHASNSNTSTVATNQTAPSMELSRIPEAIEGSIPGTVPSVDIVLNFNSSLHHKNKNRLSAITPSSYVSNVSDIVDSVHLDDEVLGSDEEYNLQTPKGPHDIYLEPHPPVYEKMQSEGGEQYHKLHLSPFDDTVAQGETNAEYPVESGENELVQIPIDEEYNHELCQIPIHDIADAIFVD
eukprot:600758_1